MMTQYTPGSSAGGSSGGGFSSGQAAAQLPAVSPASTSYRDRTAELLAIADRLRKAQGAAGGSTANGDVHRGAGSGLDKAGGFGAEAGGRGHASGASGTGAAGGTGPQQQQSEFARRASRIGLSIHETSKKLQKLAKLAKRTSMFDDPTVEIQDLTAVIKQDITALNAAIADLQALCESQSDGGGGGRGSKQSTVHSTTVVDDLKTRLMSTTKEFRDVLTMRTENLKVHENRRQLFSAASATATGIAGSSARQRPFSAASPSSAAPPPWAAGSSATKSASQLFTSNPRRGSFDPLNRGAMEQSQALLPAAQDTYMASRSEALQNVENTIVELSGIFRELATMVAQQGEMAIRIDQDMEDTLANVEGAQGALLKYFNNISSNRWLIIKIFFVLIVFLLIFVLFVA